MLLSHTGYKSQMPRYESHDLDSNLYFRAGNFEFWQVLKLLTKNSNFGAISRKTGAWRQVQYGYLFKVQTGKGTFKSTSFSCLDFISVAMLGQLTSSGFSRNGAKIWISGQKFQDLSKFKISRSENEIQIQALRSAYLGFWDLCRVWEQHQATSWATSVLPFNCWSPLALTPPPW